MYNQITNQVYMRVLSLSLLELIQFTSPNPSIYFHFLHAVPLSDVIMRYRFLMSLPSPSNQGYLSNSLLGFHSVYQGYSIHSLK